MHIESDVKAENFYSCERCYASFSRTIPIPAAIETEKTEATYDNGIVEIALPKVVETKPKEVEIAVK